MTTWNVIVTPEAEKQLSAIRDRRIQQNIVKTMRRLEHEPEKQGKALTEELAGFRSVRAVGQRYRIIYRVVESKVIVYIVLVGLRQEGAKKDVYEIARRLLQQGLLEPPDA